MKILVLGANGMLGSMMMHVLSQKDGWNVEGVVRSGEARGRLPPAFRDRVTVGGDLNDFDHLADLFERHRPDVLVNCAGLTKHARDGQEVLPAVAMNTLLPQRLAKLGDLCGTRLIHVSTDCVFSGKAGDYRESDVPDAGDVYGQSKRLGEVTSGAAVTLRSSIIGPELGTCNGLLEWFLAQTSCLGYRKAVFSGFPTVEFARVVRDVVIPHQDLRGLYHVSSSPIDKYSLLCLIAKVYGLQTRIDPDDLNVIDRSLNSELFQSRTGYRAPSWPEMVTAMRDSVLK